MKRIVFGVGAVVLLLGLAACSQAAPAPAVQSAPKGTIVLMTFGGPWVDKFNKIAPEFTQATGWKTEAVDGGSTSVEMINKVQAAKDSPQVDIVQWIDEVVAKQASAQGLLAPWDPNIVTNAKNLPDWAKEKDLLFNGLTAPAIVYNPKVFKEKGWAPPSAWQDLFDPKYAGHIVMQTMTGNYTLTFMVHLARAGGGGEANMDPAFAKMKELAPRVLSFEGAAQRYGELFQNGQGWIGVYSNISPFDMKSRGFPIDFVYPKDGLYVNGSAIMAVKGRPAAQTEGTNLLLNFLLGETAQQFYAKDSNWSPTNTTIKLPPDVAERGITADMLKNARRLDQDLVNKNRAAWNERWQKEIESIKRQ